MKIFVVLWNYYNLCATITVYFSTRECVFNKTLFGQSSALQYLHHVLQFCVRLQDGAFTGSDLITKQYERNTE